MPKTVRPTQFALQHVIDSIYSKGVVKEFTWDGQHALAIPSSNSINVLNAESFSKLARFPTHSDEDFAVSSYGVTENLLVVVSSKNLVTVHTPSNDSPAPFRIPLDSIASCVEYSDSGSIFAFGFTDGSVRVVDVVTGATIVKTRLGGSDVVTNMRFLDSRTLVIAVKDGKISVLDLKSAKVVTSVEAHSSTVTSMTSRGSMLITASLDKTITSWIYNGKNALSKSTTVALGACPVSVHFRGDGIFVIDSEGCVAVTDSSLGRTIPQKQLLPKDAGLFVTRGLHSSTPDRTYVLINDRYMVLCGANFDIISAGLLELGQCISVHLRTTAKNSIGAIFAHSSPEVVLIDDARSRFCSILSTKGEAVISSAVSSCQSIVAAGSKDNSIYLWRLDSSTAAIVPFQRSLSGHTDTVTALCFSPDNESLFSASSDLTLKCWRLSSDSPTSVWTVKAHEKDINSISIHPSGKLIASASQDKLVKVLDAATGKEVATLSGHTRSVWCVKFDASGNYIATSSADRTVKIWSAQTYACIKTIEGHSASVLSLEFLQDSSQVVSTSSNGLIKVMDVSDSRCLATIDEHFDRIWSCHACLDGQYVATASDDCTIKIWSNNSDEEAERLRLEEQQQQLAEQELQNCVKRKDFVKAISLALDLRKPHQALTLFCKSLENMDLGLASTFTDEFVSKLSADNCNMLLRFAKEWNAKFSQLVPSHILIRSLLKHIKLQSSGKGPESLTTLHGLIAHSDQHLAKIDEMLIQISLCDILVKDF